MMREYRVAKLLRSEPVLESVLLSFSSADAKPGGLFETKMLVKGILGLIQLF